MSKLSRKIYYRVFGLTDRGKVREINEDAFLINKELDYFVVADGMGGLDQGEVASAMAVALSEKAVGSLMPKSKEEDTFTEDSFPDSDEEALKQVVSKTNREIHKQNVGKDKKMGTTFVCAKILGKKIGICHSGDSRCYHIQKGNMIRLTQDHSPAEEMIQSGRAEGTEKEIKKLMRYVRGALGVDSEVDPDVVFSIPQKGDIYLLCTDGLTKVLADSKLANMIATSKNIEEAAQSLVHLGNELGAPDNITVLLLEITGVGMTFRKGKAGIAIKEKGSGEDTFTE